MRHRNTRVGRHRQFEKKTFFNWHVRDFCRWGHSAGPADGYHRADRRTSRSPAGNWSANRKEKRRTLDERCCWKAKSRADRPRTLLSCELIHLPNVFFWTSSRSSGINQESGSVSSISGSRSGVASPFVAPSNSNASIKRPEKKATRFIRIKTLRSVIIIQSCFIFDQYFIIIDHQSRFETWIAPRFCIG